MMPNNKMIPLIYMNGHYAYINEQVLKKLRSGDLNTSLGVVAAAGFLLCVILQLAGVDAFTILDHLSKLNAPTLAPGLGPGGPGNPGLSSSIAVAGIPTRAQEFNDMLKAFNEKKIKYYFVMTKDEALKTIRETYTGEVKIGDNNRFSAWQAAKKLYHAPEFGINPELYGITKDDLRRLNFIGLTNYVREGRPLPPMELINDFQMAVKNMCENPNSRRFDGEYSSRGEEKTHDAFYCCNKYTRQVAAFNKETRDIITAGKYNLRAYNRFVDTRHLGNL